MNRIIDSRHFFDFIAQNATPSEVEGIDSAAYFKCFEDICLTTRENEIEDLRKKLPLHLCPLSWLEAQLKGQTKVYEAFEALALDFQINEQSTRAEMFDIITNYYLD